MFLLLPKLNEFYVIGRHALRVAVVDPTLIGASAGMTKKSLWVPVMPVPELVRDDGSGIQSILARDFPEKSLNLTRK